MASNSEYLRGMQSMPGYASMTLPWHDALSGRDTVGGEMSEDEIRRQMMSAPGAFGTNGSTPVRGPNGAVHQFSTNPPDSQQRLMTPQQGQQWQGQPAQINPDDHQNYFAPRSERQPW